MVRLLVSATFIAKVDRCLIFLGEGDGRLGTLVILERRILVLLWCELSIVLRGGTGWCLRRSYNICDSFTMFALLPQCVLCELLSLCGCSGGTGDLIHRRGLGQYRKRFIQRFVHVCSSCGCFGVASCVDTGRLHFCLFGKFLEWNPVELLRDCHCVWGEYRLPLLRHFEWI